MQSQSDGKVKGRKSSWTFIWISCLIMPACLAIIAFVCLVPLFAMVHLVGLIGDAIGSLLAPFLLVVASIAYLLWLILIGEWSQILAVLPELLGWLRSIGIL